MPFALRIEMPDLEKVHAGVAEMASRASNFRPVLQAFGIHMLRSIQKNFDVGGRPTPWIPSGRVSSGSGPNPNRLRGKRNLKTLVDKGRLKNSPRFQVTGNRSLKIGTNVVYAAVHQFGIDRVVSVPEHIRKTGKVRTPTVQATKIAIVKSHQRHMRLPARPFLLVQVEDIEVLKGMLQRHLGGGASQQAGAA